MKATFIALTCTICVTCLTSAAALAGVAKTASVDGVITNIDSDNVTLAVEGQVVTVPRDAVPTYYTIRPGNRVTAYLKTESLARPLPAAKKSR